MSLNQYGKDILKQMQEQQQEQPKGSKPKKEIFEAKNVNEWLDLAEEEEDQKQLLGDLWYENELCVMFASSNVGKSILAVQVADALSKGIAIAPFKNEAPPQKVLYFDFELTMKQFANRCVHKENPRLRYDFNKNFIRVEHNPQEAPDEYKSPEAYLLIKMREKILAHDAKIIVLDNLTMMNPDGNDNKRTKKFVGDLKAMKDAYGLSILMIGHSKKKNIQFEPLNDADLYGSSMLFNFIDSCFGIGRGRNEERYLKQFKTRNGELVYSHKNVPTYDIDKVNHLLMFKFRKMANENRLLAETNEVDNNRIIELYDKRLSGYEIAKEVGISPSSVYRIIRQHKAQKKLQEELEKREQEEAKRAEEDFLKFIKDTKE